jgi:hypothetical protein
VHIWQRPSFGRFCASTVTCPIGPVAPGDQYNLHAKKMYGLWRYSYILSWPCHSMEVSVSFTPRSRCPPATKLPVPIPMDRRLDGPCSRSRCGDCRASNPGCPACMLVIILTELPESPRIMSEWSRRSSRRRRRRHHHHHHRRRRSGLTHPEVSSMVFPDSYFLNLGNLLRGIRFNWYIQFHLQSSRTD